MKTSIQWSGLWLGLILAASVWAQDENEEQSGQAVEDSPAAQEATAGDSLEQGAGEIQAASEPGQQAAENPAEAAESTEQAEAAAGREAAASGDAGSAAGKQQESAAGDTAEPMAMAQEAVPESAETFVFQGHPIFPPGTAELVYRPLVNYLNDALPYRFDLELSPDYHRYWLSARRGHNPHLVLEEPHLTAYRMEQYGYTPLVRAQAPLTYSLLTSMDNAEASARDFVGRRVSTMPAPSLGYLILTSWFENPMQQPIILSNAASWLDAVEIVFSQEADAAIVPNNLVARYVNMANVLTSREFPGVTIAASPEVPADIQAEIQAALMALHEDEEHFAVLNELDISQFIEAQRSQYDGLEKWLELVYSTL